MLLIRHGRKAKSFLPGSISSVEKLTLMNDLHHGSNPTEDQLFPSQFSFQSRAFRPGIYPDFASKNDALVSSKIFQNHVLQVSPRWISDSVVGEDSSLLPDSESVAKAGSEVANVALGNLSEVGNEVAKIASDSLAPIAGIQHLIEAVHIYLDLPWWMSIAAVTVCVRFALFPLLVYQKKAAHRLSIIRPELEKLGKQFKESDGSPETMEKYRTEAHRLFKEHKTSPLSVVIGPLVQAPLFIFFFLAVQRMAIGLDSFKTGGILWFTDLSVPDPLYILPVISGISLLTTVQLGAEGIEDHPNAAVMKKVFFVIGVASIPLTSTFSAALFCYWLPSNMISIFQALAFKISKINKALGIPETQLSQNSSDAVASSSTVAMTLDSFKSRQEKFFQAQKQRQGPTHRPVLYKNKRNSFSSFSFSPHSMFIGDSNDGVGSSINKHCRGLKRQWQI